jgi:hypothetical protein
VVTLEDNPRGNFRIHMNEPFMDRMRAEVAKGLSVKEAIETTGLVLEKQEATVPVAEPVPEVKEVTVKEAKPKLSKEEKEAEKAKKEADKKAKADAKEAEKAKKEADKTAKADAKVKKAEPEPVVAPEPVKAEPEPVAKPEVVKTKPAKAKFVGNMEKLNPTQDKMLKKVASELKVELADDSKAKFLAFVNALDNKDFNAKKLEEHAKEFLTPKAPELKDEEMVEREHNGKTYCVNIKGEVFEDHVLESGETVAKKVGNVGLAQFAGMEKVDPKEFE